MQSDFVSSKNNFDQMLKFQQFLIFLSKNKKYLNISG